MSWNAPSPTSMRSSTTKKPIKRDPIMKIALQLLLSGLVLALVVVGCSGPAGTPKYEEKGLNPKGQQAGSAAHGAATQSTAQPSSNENYGEEVSRLVYEKDEIVSVLKNGMV